VILLFISQNIIYSADTIKFYPEKNIIILISNAQVIYGDLKVFADTLIYLLKEKKLIARSSPKLYEKDREIRGREMEYYIDDKKGFANDAKTQIEKGYFYGKRTVYLEKNILKIRNGYFTTCDKDEPDYYFFSPEIKVVLDNRIIARNIILFVKGIPVFYLPFWMRSIVKERRSGFLVPKIGFSGYGGRFIQNIGWYQTLTRYADATIWFDYYTATGVWVNIETRYLLKKNSGNLNLNYIKERGGNKRWSIIGSGNNTIPGDIKLSYFSNYRSDNRIDVDYNQGETRLQEEANAEISLSKSFKFGSISARAQEKKDFIKKTTKMEIPRIDLNLYGLKIFGINPNISSSILRDKNGIFYSSSQTGFSFTKTFFPLRTSFGITISHLFASKTMDSTYYSDFPRTYNLSLKTTIYGISRFGFLFVERFRTVIDPSISYSIREKGKDGNLFPDALFSINNKYTRSFNYNLSIMNQWKIKDKVITPLSFNIGSSYNFEEKIFQNPNFQAQLFVSRTIASDITGFYDINKKKIFIKNITNLFSFSTDFEGHKFDLNISHSVNISDTTIQQSASLRTGFYLTKNWNVSLNTIYNFKDMRFNNTGITLNRDLHCWSLEFSYTQYQENWNYSFRIGIKEIPDIKLEKNTIKGLFP